MNTLGYVNYSHTKAVKNKKQNSKKMIKEKPTRQLVTDTDLVSRGESLATHSPTSHKKHHDKCSHLSYN